MTKYLFKRLLYGLVSVIVVVAIVMIMIYSLLEGKKTLKRSPHQPDQTGEGIPERKGNNCFGGNKDD